MAIHHRHKQRMLTTLISLIVLTLCTDAYLLLARWISFEMSLLLTFAIGILLLTLYHFYNYEHCHEHLTMINNLTQIYFGAVLLVSIVLMLLLRWIFSIEIFSSYIILSVIVILLVFLTLGPYDRFLEEHLGTRFPMNAPSPHRPKKASAKAPPKKVMKAKRKR